MKEQSAIKNTGHIVWMDVVRVVALYMLVACHCATQFSWSVDWAPNPEQLSFWGSLWGSMLRPVPIFVMLTGALLLPVKTSAPIFYKKRITRVVAPFFIWTALYCFFPFVTKAFGMESGTLFSLFPYAVRDFYDAPLKTAFDSFAHIPLNFNTINLHLWYVYLLVGLYLYLPIFSCWVEKASDREKRFFLGLWAVTLLLPYYNMFCDKYIWGSCTWNMHFHALYYFAGWNGYLLLGHYLRNRNWETRKVLCVCIPMLIIGYFITYLGHNWTLTIPSHSEELYEVFWTNNSINVMMMDVSIFLICRCAVVNNEKVKHILANSTLCCFGIYMVHFFFVGPIVNTCMEIMPIGFVIPVSAVFTLAASWAFVAIAYRFIGPKVKWIFG